MTYTGNQGTIAIFTHAAIGMILASILCLSACKQADQSPALSETTVEQTLKADKPVLALLDAGKTGIDFQNTIVETFENNITNNINIYNGGGVCIIDVNKDELPDVYFVSANGKNRLYLNEGNLHFKDITDAAGLASEEGFETAAVCADVNADGLQDIYVCRAGADSSEIRQNKLYINNGNLSFTEKSREYGLADQSASSGACFLDFDNDGDLDCYVLNYPTSGGYTNKIEARLNKQGVYEPQLLPRGRFDSDRLYRNDQGKFVDVSQKAGIWNLAYGLSVSITDINYDGYPDIYVGNDFIQPDFLYINNKNGTFSNRLGDFFRHTSQHTMGTDFSDFDGDGLVDLFAMDMLASSNYRQKTFVSSNSQSSYTAMMQHGYFEPVVRNVLQRNAGNGQFHDVACIGGVYKTDWSWSGLLFDMDNNGLRDLHVTNGYRRDVADRDFMDFILPDMQKTLGSGPKAGESYLKLEEMMKLIPVYKSRNFCFQNNGDWSFSDRSGQWMTMEASWSCGSAWSDLDKDGDLDLVVNNLEQPAFVYENKSAGTPNGHYLQIKVQGNAGNPLALGASAMIRYQGGKQQYADLYPVRGIFSSVEYLLHFGLGSATQIEQLTVRWPDGKTQTLNNIAADQRLTLQYADASGYVAALKPDEPATTFLQALTNSASAFQHRENAFNDFENWPLNPWKVSEAGPALAIGDVNGDGLDDFYIGNSFDQAGALYVQQNNGDFKAISNKTWEADKLFEDHGALMFDADNDNDLDLFVLSGGAEATSPQAWQNRLYINTDGKGNFMKAPGAIPPSQEPASRAVAVDYDRDGDQDLIIGGRFSPGKWPITPRSSILRNDRTRFTDVTSALAPDFERCGMVTDLQLLDIDQDNMPELVVLGEWMPLKAYKLEPAKFIDISAKCGFEKSNGLWNRLQAADLDGDGDMDLVSGNLGHNTRYTASLDAPLCCYAADFDNNGTLDPIMAFYENGQLYPYPLKETITKHIPILKKKVLYAKVYAKSSLKDIIPQAELDKALNLRAYTLASCWWENQNGSFTRHDFPNPVQIAPVYGIGITDLNADGLPELLMAGNKYGMDVETNRCDAGNGSYLQNKGKGQLSFVDNRFSGFWAIKEGRDLGIMRSIGNKKLIVVANNNGPLQFFKPSL